MNDPHDPLPRRMLVLLAELKSLLGDFGIMSHFDAFKKGAGGGSAESMTLFNLNNVQGAFGDCACPDPS